MINKQIDENEVEEFRGSGAAGKYTLTNMGEVELGEGKKAIITKVGDKRYSPIMAYSKEELEDMAYEMAEIIEKNNRKTIVFSEILSKNKMKDYPLPCLYGNVLEEYTDTGSKCNQSGFLQAEQLNNTIELKKACAQCPFSKDCLAVSLTTLQNTRMSKNSKTIPQSDPPLSISEFLIFGGYTPQERLIIFDKVCEILEEYDKYHSNKENEDSFV